MPDPQPTPGSQVEPKDGPQNPPVDPPADPPAEPTPDKQDPPAEPPKDDNDSKLDELPDWAQKEIRRVRSEAAAARVQKRELEEQLRTAVKPEDYQKALKDLQDANRKSTVADLIEEFELPASAKGLIRGDTEEELRAFAEGLAAFAPAAKRDPDLPPPLEPAGGREPGKPPGPSPKDLLEMANRRRGRFS